MERQAQELTVLLELALSGHKEADNSYVMEEL